MALFAAVLRARRALAAAAVAVLAWGVVLGPVLLPARAPSADERALVVVQHNWGGAI
ncbi:hypothetical protein [Streptomyces sp. NPDC006307]|uniref:hypothetical protein n=1 Tax=Streptomyces sp. NPDC006307 TaxID=3156748 RepID=UPI0033AB5050